jgi:hypothetical protein
MQYLVKKLFSFHIYPKTLPWGTYEGEVHDPPRQGTSPSLSWATLVLLEAVPWGLGVVNLALGFPEGEGSVSVPPFTVGNHG